MTVLHDSEEVDAMRTWREDRRLTDPAAVAKKLRRGIMAAGWPW
jgi:hypothetical protein